MYITKYLYQGKNIISELSAEQKTESSCYEIGIIDCYVIERGNIEFICCDCIENQLVDSLWMPLLCIIDASRLGRVSMSGLYFPIVANSIDQIELNLISKHSNVKLLIRFNIRKRI